MPRGFDEASAVHPGSGAAAERFDICLPIPPRLPRTAVVRDRLVDMIDQGASGPLTLVSAPAGTGKTTAVATWVASGRREGPILWMSLGEDAHASRLWPALCEGLYRNGLLSPDALAGFTTDDEALAAIAFSLSDSLMPITLVLDCAAELPEDTANRMHRLVTGSAGRLHLIILTRADPLLPLHLYRLNQSVVEIRIADLAFTVAEANDLLMRRRVTLPRDIVEELVARTRGWAAGLVMSSMSLAHARDPGAAVRRIGGASGRIAEYLLTEVLAMQTPPARELLLRTSVVDCVEPGLAEALAGPDASRSLAFLARGNVFVEEVPDVSGSYKYHPLFRELLVAQLTCEAPELATQLHLAAAMWFADEGLIEKAVRTAIAADGWDHAAGIVVDKLALGTLLLSSGAGLLREVFIALPGTATSTAAELVRAALALAKGDYRACHAYLDAARPRPDASTSAWPAAALGIGLLDAVCLASTSADPQRLLEAATAARTLLHEEGRAAAHPELVVLVESATAQALFHEGRFAEAAEAATAATSVTVPGLDAQQVTCLGRLAFIAAWSGHCRRAIQLARRANAATAHAPPPNAGSSALADVALAWAYTDTRELRQASQYVSAAEQAAGDPLPPSDAELVKTTSAIVRSRIQRARRDLPRARATLDGCRLPDTAGRTWVAEALVVEHAAIELLAGAPHRALEIPTCTSAPVRDAASMVRAEAQLLCSDAPAPVAMPEDMAKGDLSLRVHGLLLDALYHAQLGDDPSCEEALERALRLAAPEHLRRPFREAPEPVRRALSRHRDLAARHRWLFVDQGGGRKPNAQGARGQVTPNAPRAVPELTEQLTDKELEVLGLLAQLLTTEETAAAMFISVNTVRTHVRNILRKLGVRGRNQAIRRARDLGILPPTHATIPD
jgi:LuxR family maltose regulon positive regulatory protein